MLQSRQQTADEEALELATTGTIADDDSLRAGAKEGFEYIRSISEIEDGLLRIPYGWGAETWAGLYEFGWAHGLSGTALFFARMQKAGIDAGVAAEFASLSRHTILNINLPGAPAAPFAEPSTPLDKRFGRAGVLSLLSQWSAHEPAAEDVVTLRSRCTGIHGWGTCSLYWHISRGCWYRPRDPAVTFQY